MLFNESHERIKQNFEMLEDQKKKQRRVDTRDLLFIIFSILIMIPYEMASSALWLKIFGGINLACDLVFVALLWRLRQARREKVLTPFLAVTDILAALPGISAVILLAVSALFVRDFHFGDYLAAGGLGIATLKTTKFLRVLRVTRLFRVMRNVKLLRFISLKSDSNSAEMTVGWLGFILLSLLIAVYFVFVFAGPLAMQEDFYFSRIKDLREHLEKSGYRDFNEVFSRVFYSNLKDRLIYIRIGDMKQYYNEQSRVSPWEAESRISREYCSVNSTLVKAKDIGILLDDKEFFHENRVNNLIWIVSIILSVLIFSFLATLIIGRDYTDLLNECRQAILNAYSGIPSAFAVDMEKQGKNDRDSFAFAMGVYTRDFALMKDALSDLERRMELKDSEVEDLNNAVRELEQGTRAGSAGETAGPSGSEPSLYRQDLETALDIIRRLCAKHPEALEKIRVNFPFKTARL